MRVPFLTICCCGLLLAELISRPAVSSENKVDHTDGVTTLPLWPNNPPQFQEDAPAEQTDEQGGVTNVTVPSITVFLPPEEKNAGMAILVNKSSSLIFPVGNDQDDVGSHILNMGGI